MPTTNKALFSIVGATTSPSSERGYDAAALETLTFALEDTTGVLSVIWQAYDPADETSPLASLDAPPFNFVESGTPAYSTLVAAVTASSIVPADVTPVSNSWLVRCTASTADGDHVFTRAVNRIGTKTRKPVPGETTENGTRGWADAIALLIENGVSSPGAPGVGLVAAADVLLTSNDTLSGTATRDGVTLSVGMRALAIGQTTPSQNGMWVVAAGAWTRPADYATDPQVAAALGVPVYVEPGGTVGGNTFWYQKTGITIAGSKTFAAFASSNGIRTVVDNAERDAIPALDRYEGMLVYSAKTKVYYVLGSDLTTWSAHAAHPELSLQADWYISDAIGDDNNDGTASEPLASIDELRTRLNPNDSFFRPEQNVTIHVLDGLFAELDLNLSIPVGSDFVVDVLCSYTSSSAITLATVVDTVATTATLVRGRITTGAGTFTDKCRIRSTSGANSGAITYCEGLNSSTDAWVKQWFRELSVDAVQTVTIAPGTTCVVDTLLVSIDRVRIKLAGHPRGGVIRISNALLPYGAEFINIVGGSNGVQLSGCKVGNSDAVVQIARVAGNMQFRNCQVWGTNELSVSGPLQQIFLGCAIETTVRSFGSAAFLGGNSFNGGRVVAGTEQSGIASQVQLAQATWVNGSGTGVTVYQCASVRVTGQQSSSSTHAVGWAVSTGGHVVSDTIAQLSIAATQQATMAGQNVAYADLPQNLVEADCSFSLANATAARVAITSIFGRVGRTIVAAIGDYTSTQVTNSSSVTSGGASVTTALNALQAQIAAAVAGVSSVYGRVGAVVAAAGDYTDAQINNTSTVAGTHVNDALTNLKTSITALVTGVSSAFGRTGAVVATTGDYTSTQVTNSSSVTSGGASVTTALNALQSQIAASVSGVASVFGRSGTVVANAGDYTSTLVSNVSAVTGSSVTAALNALNTALATAGPISSVFGRTGAVVAAAADYNSTLVSNVSGVSGSTVTAALNTLNSAIAALVSGVSSVYGRTGAVVAASGDYTGAQVTNTSSVSGATVTAALNTLLSSVGALVTGVSSVYGRTGAVVSVAGDYTSTLVTNLSAVTGSTVTAALNALNSAIAAGVSSVYGRTGAVVATLGDYTSAQVSNTSSVSGSTVTGALNFLYAMVTGLTSSQVSNLSGASGSTVTAALDDLFTNTYRAVDNRSGAITLVASDAGKLIILTADSAVTVPGGIFSARDQVDFIVTGGTVHTFAAGVNSYVAPPGGSGTAPNDFATVYQLRYIGTQGSVDSFSLVQLANTQGSDAVANQSTVAGTVVSDALDNLKTGADAGSLALAAFAGISIPIIPIIASGWAGGITDDFSGAGSGGQMGVPIPLYNGLRLTTILVSIEPNTGHGGVMPGGMPFIQIWITSPFSHTPPGISASYIDPTNNTTAYEVQHTLVISGLSITPAVQTAWLRIADETGVSGLRLKSIVGIYAP